MRSVEQSASGLQLHFQSTYHSLRLGIAAIGVALPLLLWLGGGIISSVPLQGSMSAYYHTSWRDVFVGGLCAVGAALYLYKGFSSAENWVLNAAGALAVCVAIFPTRSGTDWTVVNYVHVASAVLFFLCLAYISLFRASDTLSLIRDTSRAEMLQRVYRTLGGVMVGSPVVALAVAWFFRSPTGATSNVFFLEAFGVWAFGAYWLVKTFELKQTSADRAAAEGILQAAPESAEKPAIPGKLIQVAPLDESVEELRQSLVERSLLPHGFESATQS